MSADLGIGKLITTEQFRDAIHVAVMPVVAARELKPGEKVSLRNGVVDCLGTHVGIIDPFLTQYVRKGQKCWLFMFPGSITSLRHEWTHPALENIEVVQNPIVQQSIDWLVDFGRENGYSYEWLLERGKDAIETGGTYVGDDDDQDVFNTYKDEFLYHASVVLGLKITGDSDGRVYFSCAC